MKLSIIVPCFNEEAVLPFYRRETQKVLQELVETRKLTYEYILIDDGSSDGTLAYLRSWHAEDPCVRYISFTRNFGKEAGLLAGLRAAEGDYIVVMDADLQDPPSLLPQMLDAVVKEGYDCAATRRSDRRGEPPVRSWFARRFYAIVNHDSSARIMDGARDFRLMSRQMKDAVLSMGEYNRFSKGIFAWVGFRTKWISYQNVERAAGKTKWSFWSLCRYAVDGIVGYTTRPLEIAAWIGIVFFVLSLAGILFIIVRKLIFGDPVAGWPSLVVIILFVSGIQLFCTGVIGEYLAKTYLEVKKRPVYLIRETEKDQNSGQ